MPKKNPLAGRYKEARAEKRKAEREVKVDSKNEPQQATVKSFKEPAQK